VTTHSTSDAARLAAVLTGLLLAACVPVALAADASALRSQAAGLRSDASSLDARANAATLELYSFEVQLSQARAAAAAIAARRQEAERERAATRAQLQIARRALQVSDARLAALLRALYEQSGDTDPLAVVLGAGSLEEAMTGLDNLDRAAGENQRIVEQAAAARSRLDALDARLAARVAQLAELEAAAEAREARLVTASTQRRAYVAALRQRQGLNAARVAEIERRVSAAETRTTAITAAAAPVVSAAVETPAPTSVGADGSRTLTVSVTGYSIRGRTATGMPTAPGVVAVDPGVIPLGTRLSIPGYGEGIAADTGGAVQGNTIDVWFPTQAQALAWGRRTVTITLG
jgi:cystine transport system substrate-binding protein